MIPCMNPSEKSRTAPAADGAFTLLEGMAAVAIIAVLFSLLMPVVRSFRGKSLAAKCTNNLRQIGVGMTAYAGENNGAFPHTYVRAADRVNEDDQYSWMQKTARYLGISDEEMQARRAVGPFVCPEWAMGSDRRVSYGLSRLIDPARCLDKPGQSWDYRAMNTTPSDTFLVLEMGDNDDIVNEYPGRPNSAQRRHPKDSPAGTKKGSANVLFVDGHVETLSGEIAPDDPRWKKK